MSAPAKPDGREEVGVAPSGRGTLHQDLPAPALPSEAEINKAIASLNELAKQGEDYIWRPACHTRDLIAALAYHVGLQWQPISTAPKDGTPILACREGGQSVWKIRWGADKKWGLAGALPMDWEPTHWMPLPAPPAEPHAGVTPMTGTAEEIREAAQHVYEYFSDRNRPVIDKHLTSDDLRVLAEAASAHADYLNPSVNKSGVAREDARGEPDTQECAMADADKLREAVRLLRDSVVEMEAYTHVPPVEKDPVWVGIRRRGAAALRAAEFALPKVKTVEASGWLVLSSNHRMFFDNEGQARRYAENGGGRPDDPVIHVSGKGEIPA